MNISRVSALFVLLLAACKEDVEVNNTFCNLPARFTMENTYQAPVLYTACQSMGEFCTITTTQDGNKFVFRGSTAKADTIPMSGKDEYTGFYLGLSGLIVGLPNIPEMGKDTPVVTCYDLACPNCYETHHTTPRMAMQESGYTYCSKCRRTYNLNDRGIVSNGEGGRNLYRYRTSYIGNTLVINNR